MEFAVYVLPRDAILQFDWLEGTFSFQGNKASELEASIYHKTILLKLLDMGDRGKLTNTFYRIEIVLC